MYRSFIILTLILTFLWMSHDGWAMPLSNKCGEKAMTWCKGQNGSYKDSCLSKHLKSFSKSCQKEISYGLSQSKTAKAKSMVHSKAKKAGKPAAVVAGKKGKQQAKKIAGNTKNKQKTKGWSTGSKTKPTAQLVQHKPAGQPQTMIKKPESKVQSIKPIATAHAPKENGALAPHTTPTVSPTPETMAAASQESAMAADSIDTIASDDSQNLFSTQNSILLAASLALIAAAGAGWKFRDTIKERVAVVLKRRKKDPFSANAHSPSSSSQMSSSHMALSETPISGINPAQQSSMQAPVSQFSQPSKVNTATKVRS